MKHKNVNKVLIVLFVDIIYMYVQFLAQYRFFVPLKECVSFFNLHILILIDSN